MENEIVEHIVKWLYDYAFKYSQNGYVIGVSGGIDSAVVSTLCAKTGMKTIVLGMPIHQHVDHLNRSKLHMNWLCKNFTNVSQYTFDLTDTFNEFSKIFNSLNIDLKKEKRDLSLANSRSRLRMSALYSIANANSMLVCGTGNRIEDVGIKYFTKGGDGMVDVSPIGDLLKSEVYEIGKFLNIDESIIKAKPSDGLYENELSDEDNIGATYDELEWAMMIHEKEGDSPYLYNFTDRQKKVWQIYIYRNKINSHKMEMPPICPIHTKKTISL